MRAVRVILAAALVSGGLLRPLAAERPVVGEFRLVGGLSAAARAELSALAADSGGQVLWSEADGAVQIRSAEWADRLTAWAERNDIQFPAGAAGEPGPALSAAEAVLVEKSPERSISAESSAILSAALGLGGARQWQPSGPASPLLPPPAPRNGTCGPRAPPAA